MTRRRAAAPGLLLLWTLAVACGGGSPPPDETAPSAAAAAGRSIDPPAAPGSLAPNLALAGGELLLSWLEPVAAERHRLLVSRLAEDGWTAPVTVVEDEGFFANWADLPAVVASGDGSLVAHWLARTGEATYAYSVFLARSLDGGASWAELGRLPDDDTPTEHGFVSWVPDGQGLRAFWLDGREMLDGGAMGLRTAWIGDTVGASEVLDDRTCECCSTDAAPAAAGPLVVYRDRDGDEVRDVAVVRRTGGGWSVPAVAAVDGWKIAGCPVNGPAVDAAGRLVALAWFTGAGEELRVRAAFSTDGGESFGRPLEVDGARPNGRVDVVLDGAGGAVVAWLGQAGDAGAIRLRRATPDGRLGEPLEIALTGAGRASGFPRLARLDGSLYLAWVDTTPTDGQRLRARAVALERLALPSTGGESR